MNYRHAYHAGNFADVLKHVVLARLITYLQRKDKAFRVVDTHAGIGRYNLKGIEAGKTAEWQAGIGRFMADQPTGAVKDLLQPYRSVIEHLNPDGELMAYPGSPLLARALFRKQDRLTATELHPEDYETLSGHFTDDYQARIVHLDGWLALGSFVPVKEKRGLVLVDPPFESRDEFSNLADGFIKAHRRWPNGVYMLWYPVKDRAQIRRFHETLKRSEIKRLLAVELSVKPLSGRDVFAGSGLVIANPPWNLGEELSILLPYLKTLLAQDNGASWTVTELAGE
ncbi:23S rRNA (adenine(2030)-N(6))-methyltransferase RlmJ [Coralliovum pocilloporae]|uniref:23S rRNA (adenine(2030)-N(6))-methyltransferase RlmJ n=1 Tax=Coralliovum pocilloporae TaxID=3066369 RepID=UPI003306C4C0